MSTLIVFSEKTDKEKMKNDDMIKYTNLAFTFQLNFTSHK